MCTVPLSIWSIVYCIVVNLIHCVLFRCYSDTLCTVPLLIWSIVYCNVVILIHCVPDRCQSDPLWTVLFSIVNWINFVQYRFQYGPMCSVQLSIWSILWCTIVILIHSPSNHLKTTNAPNSVIFIPLWPVTLYKLYKPQEKLQNFLYFTIIVYLLTV